MVYTAMTVTVISPIHTLLPDESVVLEEKDYRTISPTAIGHLYLKSDYSQNFLKGKAGSLGSKLSFVKTDNTFDFYNVIDGEDQLDETRSNKFCLYGKHQCILFNYSEP
jgi:hypothetical protein